MLIKCPNCNAQYEVPNDIIPAAGRDVQCSSCSKTWFVTSLSGKKSTKDKVSKYESLEKGNLSKFETTESFLTDKSNKEVDHLVKSRHARGGLGQPENGLGVDRDDFTIIILCEYCEKMQRQ